MEDNRSLTYQRLSDEVARGRSELVKRGVERGDRALFAAGHSLDATVALLAYLAAGAMVVPLNPRSGVAGMRNVLAATQAATPGGRRAFGGCRRGSQVRSCCSTEPGLRCGRRRR